MIDRLRSLSATLLAAFAAALLLGASTVSCSSSGEPAEPEEALSEDQEQVAGPGDNAPAELVDVTPSEPQDASPAIAAPLPTRPPSPPT